MQGRRHGHEDEGDDGGTGENEDEGDENETDENEQDENEQEEDEG